MAGLSELTMSLRELQSIDAGKRGPDWRIAKGLLSEAMGYLRLQNRALAQQHLQAAQPYIKAAKGMQS